MAGTPGQPTPWPVIGKLVAALVAAGVLIAGFLLPYVGGLGLAAQHEGSKFLDTTCNLTESAPPQKTTLLARDGKTVIATIFSQDRVPIPLSQVPTYLQQALVATEDRRFYQHHGVDMRGLIRSAISTSNGDTQGGSTLTMQYVKQIRLYQAGDNLAKQRAAVAQNLQRKMEDAQCAIAIEKRENKQQILDNYLNIAFFGENSFGLQTAAETYFGKSATDLTLPEAALLVGVLRAPSAYDPFVYPEAARVRRNQVLQNLVDVGNLTQAQAHKYQATPIQLATDKPPPVREGCAEASKSIRNVGFFCDYVVNWLEKTAGISNTDLTTGGYKIITTLDVKDQNQIQRNLSNTIPAGGQMTAILPVVDPRTGDVLAMATSKKYGNPTSPKDHTHTTLPIFTSYTAFGASTYKLFPLLTALSTGVPSDWPLQNTSPYTGSCYTPSNATNGDAQESYGANETLTSATVKSSNTFFVGLADQLLGCQLQPIVNMAEQLGMKGLNQPGDTTNQTVAQTIVDKQRAQQLVLGDVSTSPLEIAGAYAAVANDGEFNAPSPVVAIEKPVLKQGQVVADPQNDNYSARETHRPPPVQVVSPQVARQAQQILTGDTKYPGTSARPFQSWYATNSSVVAGKTGTAVAVVNSKDTQENSSIWFVGMTPSLVAATAIVNLDSPFAPSRGLPGESSPGSAYGDYASGVWLDAVGPLVKNQQWSWPDPNAVPGTQVPDLTGHTVAEATSMLTGAGFKIQQLDKADGVLCASDVAYGSVAYYAPQIAPKGATITICPSSGVAQAIAPVVVAPPPVTNQGHGGSGGHGGNPTGSPTAGATNTSGPGNGRGGSHHGPPGH